MAADSILVGSRKGLLVFTRKGGDWRLTAEHYPGVPFAYTTLDARTHTLWACADHGHWGQKLYRSPDFGASWEEVTCPVYPEGSVVKPGEPAALRYLWVLQPGGDDQPGRLYLGTEPGGLFVSDDNGDSWTLNEGLWNQPSRHDHWFGGGRDKPGIHSIIVDPRDSRHLWVGISVAGVFESTDDGASWAPCNKGLTADFLPDAEVEVGHDPHLVAGCLSQPDVLWQQNHCGIFRTTDGAANWQAVSTRDVLPHFGFAVAVDPRDGDTAWVVPAVKDECRVAVERALCVCRTTDGGQSWTALRDGLPQQHAYDIALRHALDLAGDTLVFGTTTGNLYLSADRGDSWQCLGNNLPPIYSVRFAPQ